MLYSRGHLRKAKWMLLANEKLIDPGSQALPAEPTWRLCLRSPHNLVVEAEFSLGNPRQSWGSRGRLRDIPPAASAKRNAPTQKLWCFNSDSQFASFGAEFDSSKAHCQGQ